VDGLAQCLVGVLDVLAADAIEHQPRLGLLLGSVCCVSSRRPRGRQGAGGRVGDALGSGRPAGLASAVTSGEPLEVDLGDYVVAAHAGRRVSLMSVLLDAGTMPPATTRTPSRSRSAWPACGSAAFWTARFGTWSRSSCRCRCPGTSCGQRCATTGRINRDWRSCGCGTPGQGAELPDPARRHGCVVVLGGRPQIRW
jgi:hypothetical protein